MSAASRKQVCVARIGAPHGVRGDVKLWPFTQDPYAVADYGPLTTPDGRSFEIATLRATKDHLVAHLKGVDTREAAEPLNGIELHVARDALPPADDGEFYHTDLIGLAAVTAQDTAIGIIIAVHNFGAGDIIEIAPEGGGPTLLLPFTDAAVPSVDLAAGCAVIVLPDNDIEDAPGIAEQ